MPNLSFGSKRQKAIDIVSPDATALVRFGLRSADDLRIIDTIKVIDATLMRETKTEPFGFVPRRTDTGEHADGCPFDKTGIGRGWPLFVGERGHYEIAAGNRERALELLKTMVRQDEPGGQDF